MKTPREIEIDGNVAFLPLTKGYVAIIDADDADRVGRFCWTASVEKHTIYAMRKDYSDGHCRTLKLHRFIIAAPLGIHVDHRNRNGLDNRKENLRFATKSQNMANRVNSRPPASGFRGVTFDSNKKRWTATIAADGKTYRLGHFRHAEDAADAYRRAQMSLHGEFAASGQASLPSPQKAILP